MSTHSTSSRRAAAQGVHPTEGLRLLDVAEVSALLGVSRATLARWQRDGLFPARRQLGRGRVGWPERAIRQWIETRPPAPGTAEANAQAEGDARS